MNINSIYRYTISLFGLLSTVLTAQNPVKHHYILNTDIIGNQSQVYVARDSIVLKPGFRFSTSGGVTFNAKLDPFAVFPPSDGTYRTPNGEITSDPTQGGVVGTIPGQFSVSPSGAANYTIPIEVPAGINDMQPTISLTYNSQSGNGLAGLGWQLNGLSSIVRVASTIFSNNAVKGIDLFAGNQFAIDGNRLIESGTINSNIMFRTEIETFMQIEATSSTNPESFNVHTKDGLIMEYTTKLRPTRTGEAVNEGLTYMWLLNKISNSVGNSIYFSYKQEAGLIPTIETIIYDNTRIEFSYETKVVEKRIPVAGYFMLDKYLLKGIRISNNNVLIRQYDLNYQYNSLLQQYHLQNVMLSGANSERIDGVYTSWGNIDQTIHTGTVSIDNYSHNLSEVTRRAFSSMDFDGDGVDDIVEFYHRNDYSYRHSDKNYHIWRSADWIKVYKMEPGAFLGSKYHSTLIDVELGASFDFGDFKSLTSNGVAANFNGSLKKTIIVPTFQTIQNQKSFTFKDIKSQVTINCRAADNSDKFPAYAITDLNNDGINEIVYFEKVNNGGSASIIYIKKNNLNVEHLTLSDEIIMQSLSGLITGTPTDLFIADFDADGLNDIAIVTDHGTFFLRNCGGEKDESGIVKPSFTLATKVQSINSSYGIRMGDFNGDGLSDFIVFMKTCVLNTTNSGAESWRLFANDGGWNFSNHSLPAINSYDKNYPTLNLNKDCFLTDFNKDGKMDLIRVDIINMVVNTPLGPTTGYYGSFIKWFASTGNGLVLERSVYCKEGTNNTYIDPYEITVGDYNGDGHPDIFSHATNLYNINSGRTSSSFISSSFTNNFNGNLVQSISNQIGNTISINYRPLSVSTSYPGLMDGEDKEFYTQRTSDQYPITNITVPLYCVERVNQYDYCKPALETNRGSRGPIASTLYSYEGAMVHRQGKGFLGFGCVEVYDLNTNMRTITDFELNTDYYAVLPSSLSIKKGNVDIQTTNYSNAIINFDGKRIFPYVCLQTQTDHLTQLSSDITKNMDTYGNAHTIVTTQGGLTETQQITYTNAGSWCPNKPSQIVKTSLYNGEAQTRTNSYTYNNAGNVIREVTDVADKHCVTTVFSNFDDWGRPLTTSVTAGNTTRNSSVSYTASGRFIASMTNQFGQKTTYNWDEARGILLSETDSRNRTTSYQYDGLNRLTKTIYPDGSQEVHTLQWAPSGNDMGAVYYDYTERSGSSPQWIWYDYLRREVCKQYYGLKEQKISIFTEYDELGRKHRISEPTFGNVASVWGEIYTYDTYGRTSSVNTLMGVNTYSYNGLSTTVTTPDGSTTTTLNNVGWTAAVSTNGKSINHTYYPSGLPKTTSPDGGSSIRMEYDLQGNRTKLIDPDAGEIQTTYDAFGRVLTEKQKIHEGGDFITTQYSYTPIGQLTRTGRNGEITIYSYDDHYRLVSEEIQGKHKQTYTYNNFDRIIKESEIIDGKTFTRQYEYDPIGRVRRETYPSGFYVTHQYNANGFLTETLDQQGTSLWKAIETNVYGQITQALKNGRPIQYSFDDKNRLTNIISNGIIHQTYNYTDNGNLRSRANGITGQSETFAFDTFQRLTSWSTAANGVQTSHHSIAYNPANGTIATKSDVGNATFAYGEECNKPHALTSVTGNITGIPTATLTATYTDFKKLNTLTEGNRHYTLFYGVDGQRRKSVYRENGVTKKTRYYLGNYEEETDAHGNIRKIHYISSGNGWTAVHIQSRGQDSLLFVYTDYLGSPVALTNRNNQIVEQHAFDPWGKRRNPLDWSQRDERTGWILNRGYTGHEHIDAFAIIDMNGRVYDPLTAMFLSPDPYIQAPDNWLNYNRYGYCMNNPFKYTDPNGEIAWFIPVIIGVAAGAANVAANWDNIDGFWEGAAAFGVGAGAGVAACFTGGQSFWAVAGVAAGGGALTGATNNVIAQTGKNFEGFNQVDWGEVGISSAIGGVAGFAGGSAGYWASNASFVVNGVNSPIARSAIVSPLAAGAGHVAGGTTANLIAGQNIGDAFKNSLNGIGQSMAIGGMIGVATTTAVSLSSGVNPITGRVLNENKIEYNFSETTKAHQNETNRRVPLQMLDEAIKNGVPSPDPQGSGATMYKIPMYKNGRTYILEVLYDSQTNSIWHYLYKPIK